VLAGSLVDAAGNPITPTIPVAFTSFDIGQNLLTQYRQAVQNATPLPVMSISIKAIVKPNQPDYNVIAESKGGDKNHVLVVDAHLDAIYGAGMLDNASGSATILDVARMMKNVDPVNKLRFIWFGGEVARALGIDVLRQQPELERPQSHRLRPRRGCHRDAQLHHRRARSGRAGLLRRHGHELLPQPRVQGVDDWA
jgi:Peptidase family M28